MINSMNGTGRMEQVFYSVSEVSQLFGISNKTVYRLLQRGLLQSSSALRHKRITRVSVEAFINASSNGGAR